MSILEPSSSSIPVQELSPEYDPWDPITSLRQHGRHVLTSVEMTVTNLCNMRCEHCAVGDSLTMKEGELLPLTNMLRRLEEVEHLQTISITGGEPMFRAGTVENTIVPLLKYARERGSVLRSTRILPCRIPVMSSCFHTWMSCISLSTMLTGMTSTRWASRTAGIRSRRKPPTGCMTPCWRIPAGLARTVC